MNLLDPQALQAIGTAAVQAIHERAFVRGLDASDRSLLPYSPAYQAQLKAAGESTRVDLRRTGRLEAAVLGSLQVTPDGAVLRIQGDEARVAAEVQQRRPFWGVSPTDRGAIGDALRASIVAAMDRR